MFFPSNVYPYTWYLAPLVSVVLVLVVSFLANRISFGPSVGARLGNALLKVIIHAPIFLVLRMAYLMYLAWPAYTRQTTSPTVIDFIARRAPEIAPSVGLSAAFFLVVALVANAIARSDRGRNVWVTGLVFALAYGGFVYLARTNMAVGMVVEAFF